MNEQGDTIKTEVYDLGKLEKTIESYNSPR
jgi:hypothetical protein